MKEAPDAGKLLEDIFALFSLIREKTDQLLERPPAEVVKELESRLVTTYRLPNKNPDRLDRLATIIRLLGDVPEPDGLDDLVTLLAHPDQVVTNCALETLADKMTAPSTDLMSRLERVATTSGVAAELVLELLGLIPVEELSACAQATRIYLQLLRHTDPNVVARAINTAVGYRDAEALETLMTLRGDQRVATIRREGEVEAIEMTLGLLAEEAIQAVIAKQMSQVSQDASD